MYAEDIPRRAFLGRLGAALLVAVPGTAGGAPRRRVADWSRIRPWVRSDAWAAGH